MALRVLALAAPHLPSAPQRSAALTSVDPASLFNACRKAAQLAELGIGAWGDSNWATPRRIRRHSVMLINGLREGECEWREQLALVRPNLVLIGCMTLSMPGAVACARLARECLGNDVCIVLGGHHPSESIYRAADGGRVRHHPSSPLRLMAEGRIGQLFDVVVSGDGEEVIVELGEIVARLQARGQPASDARYHLGKLVPLPGRWIAGTCDDGHVYAVVSRGSALDHNLLPAPCSLFGVRARFDTFDARPTAHVFSDSGAGCIFDCSFCSERRSVTGGVRQIGTSADRLFRQLAAAVEVIAQDYPGSGASAFVEDSTLLGFVPRQLEQLANRVGDAKWDLRWGGQLTIDQILARPDLLLALRAAGMDYLFVGLETLVPAEVGGMSKDVRRKSGSWVSRAERAFMLLHELKIRCGAALVFGLGESRQSRHALYRLLDNWRRRYAMPDPISINWGVQHPLCGLDQGMNHDYLQWGIPEGDFLDAFRDFGEASVRYPLAGQPEPTLEEVREVCQALAPLNVVQAPPTGTPVPVTA